MTARMMGLVTGLMAPIDLIAWRKMDLVVQMGPTV